MNEPNWDDKTLFHGDNLVFMRKMNSNSVDLIATDPPFNKGRDFHATPDSLAEGAKFGDRWRWNKDVHEEWLNKLEDEFPKVLRIVLGVKDSYGEDMAAYLCFMGVRLLEMRRILKPSGSIYLHCDTTASHYLKALMDAIFGKQNFRNHITWRRLKARTQKSMQQFGRVSDHILFYGSPINSEAVKIQLDDEYIEQNFNHKDERGIYQSVILTMQGMTRGESGKPWKGYDPNIIGHHWKVPKTGKYSEFIESQIPGYKMEESVHRRLEILETNNFLLWTKNGKPRLKLYLWDGLGRIPGDIWSDVGNVQSQARENTGYPTQKPLELYERIIRASSNENDVVFDPFCGCATTLVAAEKLGRQWVGIDIWDEASKVVVNRLVQEGFLSSDYLDFFAQKKGKHQEILALSGKLSFTSIKPERTDDGLEAVTELKKTKTYMPEPGPVPSRADIKKELLDKYDKQCQGCFRKFDHEDYLELDHIIPRSLGGFHHTDNRTLLCGPCNRRKSDLFTLKGLQNENKKLGFMCKDYDEKN